METLTDDQIFKIRRNLSDAGCGVPLIEKFLLLEQNHRREEQYRLLSQHRLSLLEALHQDQYKSTASTTWSMPWRKRTKNR